MPVLSREPMVFPDNLLDDSGIPQSSVSGSGFWWVLHTRPRAEKSLARLLLRQNVSYFLPIHERRRRVQRRLVCSYLPLFPGYVFLYGDEEARRLALETNLVANTLTVGDQQQLSADLTRVYEAIQSGMPLAPEERLQPGMPAEIVSGPLAGMRGRILRRQDSRIVKFVIEVQLLQRGTSVEVDSSMVRPV